MANIRRNDNPIECEERGPVNFMHETLMGPHDCSQAVPNTVQAVALSATEAQFLCPVCPDTTHIVYSKYELPHSFLLPATYRSCVRNAWGHLKFPHRDEAREAMLRRAAKFSSFRVELAVPAAALAPL